MSWQHLLMVAIYVFSIISFPFSTGKTRVYTNEYVVLGIFVGFVMLGLLVWGQ